MSTDVEISRELASRAHGAPLEKVVYIIAALRFECCWRLEFWNDVGLYNMNFLSHAL